MLLAKVDDVEEGLLACSLMLVISVIMLMFWVLICINASANCVCRSELLEAPVGAADGAAVGGATTAGGTTTAGGAATATGTTAGGANEGGAVGGANATAAAPGGHNDIGVAKGAAAGGGHNGVGAAKGAAVGTGFATGTGPAVFAFAFITVVQAVGSSPAWSMLLMSEPAPSAIFPDRLTRTSQATCDLLSSNYHVWIIVVSVLIFQHSMP